MTIFHALCIITYYFSGSDYPAFQWATTYNTKLTNAGSYTTGWYLPAADELKNIFIHASSALNNMYSILGSEYASQLSTSNYYVTSSQASDTTRYKTVKGTSFSDAQLKYSMNRVRAVHRFSPN